MRRLKPKKKSRVSPRAIATVAAFALALAAFLWLPQKLHEQGPAYHKIIVAAETLQDPTLAKSVILVTSQNAYGASGLILNRPRTPGLPANGGPADAEMLTTLHTLDLSSKDTARIAGKDAGLTQGKTFPLLIKKMGDRPRRHATFKGYVVWGRGDLTREIAAGSWKVISFDDAIAFGVAPEAMWDVARQQPAALIR